MEAAGATMAESPRPNAVPIMSQSSRAPSPRSSTGRKKKSSKNFHPFNKQDTPGKRGDADAKKKVGKQRSAHSDLGKAKSRSDGSLASLSRSMDRRGSTWSLGSATSASSTGSTHAGSVGDLQSLGSMDGSDRSLDSLLFLPALDPVDVGPPPQDGTALASLETGFELEQPADLPSDWVMHRTADGKPYFVNKKERSTTWLDPRTNRPATATQQHGIAPATTTDEWNVPLPTGWEIGETANGTRYFIDHIHRTTSWTDPRVAILNGSSLESQRQKLRLQQLKLANSEIQLQIEMIRKQQAILEHEMLQSASPETIKLAKTKAQADAYSIISLKAQHDTVQRQIDSRMLSMQRAGLADLPESPSPSFGGGTAVSPQQLMSTCNRPSIPHHQHPQHQQGQPQGFSSLSEFQRPPNGDGGHAAVVQQQPDPDGFGKPQARRQSNDRVSHELDMALQHQKGARNLKSARDGHDYKHESHPAVPGTALPVDGYHLLPELDGPLYDPTAGIDLDLTATGLEQVPLQDNAIDAFFGPWSVDSL